MAEGHLDVLASLFSISATLINWPESDLKLFTAVWVRAYKNAWKYKNAWNLGQSSATCHFTFPTRGEGRTLGQALALHTLYIGVFQS